MPPDFDCDNIKINLFFNRKAGKEYSYYEYHDSTRINLTYGGF